MTDKKERNRSAMPQVALIVDAWRQYFPGLTVTYADEAGRSVGRKDTDVGIKLADMIIESDYTGGKKTVK